MTQGKAVPSDFKLDWAMNTKAILIGESFKCDV